MCSKNTACVYADNVGSGGGVRGNSKSNVGGWFSNDNTNYYSLVASSTAYGSPFIAFSGKNYFMVGNDGRGVFTGAVYATGFNTDAPTRDGNHVRAFSAESTRATIEDTGTARIINGVGAVRFDSQFARTIEGGRGYQVFLTPDGDTRGLYTAAKYEAGFIVRETGRGHGTLYFDYRVVAHPVGASLDRLPDVTVTRLPMPNP